MIDREQVAEALEYAVIFDSRDNIKHEAGRARQTSRALKDAARAWLDQGDALVIRRDENGWEPMVREASRLAMERVGLVGFVDAFLLTMIEIQEAALSDRSDKP